MCEMTYEQGYADAMNDIANGETHGSDFSFLPYEYVRGYIAAKRKILYPQAQ